MNQDDVSCFLILYNSTAMLCSVEDEFDEGGSSVVFHSPRVRGVFTVGLLGGFLFTALESSEFEISVLFTPDIVC